MPSSFTLGACLATAHAAQVSNQGHGSAGRSHVGSLLETVKGFLKNGITTDVEDFVLATRDGIDGVTLPAIVHESIIQQREVWAEHGEFQAIKDRLTERNQGVEPQVSTLDVCGHPVTEPSNVDVWGRIETNISNYHQECRDIESDRCRDKRTCEIHLHDLWEQCEAAERDYNENHEDLHELFCPSNGTTYEFRARAKVLMELHPTRKEVLETCWADYQEKWQECIGKHDALNVQSAACNCIQPNLERWSCEYAHKIQESVNAFHSEYDEQAARYEALLAMVEADEADRRQEFTTIRAVQCLLREIRELNGAPCDTAQGVSDTIARCEHHHSEDVCLDEEYGHLLCIQYPPPPPKPPTCHDRLSVRFDHTRYPLPEPHIQTCTFSRREATDRDSRGFLESLVFSGVTAHAHTIGPDGDFLKGYTLGDREVCDDFLNNPEEQFNFGDQRVEPITYVGGECLPEVQEYPCMAAWEAREYSVLPPLPTAPFHSDNPGCNAYPPCGLREECDFDAGRTYQRQSEFFCHQNPNALGCLGMGWNCCEADTVQCLACQARRSEIDYCIIHGPDVNGCEAQLSAWCSEPGTDRSTVRWCGGH